jgi:asparagine synthase (glutamine-hydrolysing)
MCGIAGFLGNFDRTLLFSMNAILAHRGPDDSDIWYQKAPPIGLTHRRLSIIDLSPQGRQPMWDSTKKVVIVFNGEIYNYREFREELTKTGFFFNSQSDTEVLLNLYLRDGVGMLSRLNGIFAFALWDTRCQELFLARDGIGVKPLYYTENQRGFLFASELKALLQEPSVDRTLDPQAIQYYLTYLWCPAPYTSLQSVKKLEPGYALMVKNGKIQKHWQFYDLPYHQPVVAFSTEDAIEQVQYYLRQAVQRQMVADVPVGAFLSGGLDSSAVVTFAQQCAPEQKLQCFTIGFQAEDVKEFEGMAVDLPYAQQVADHLGVDLHTIYVDSGMIKQLEKMIYHLDEPQADPAPINALFISQLAREHGMKVLLSGAGGDDIFTGYRRHFALLQEKYWTWLPRFARQQLAAIAGHIPVNDAWGRRVAKAFQYADWDQQNRLVSYFFWIHPQIVESLYGPLLKEPLISEQPATPLLRTLACLPDHTHPLNQMLYLEGKHFLCDHNLNYTDKMGMAVGVEVRVPLLDLDLIALAARLPVEYKQHGRIGKWIFKKAMEPYLPYNIIYRPKTGFGAPLRYWMKHQLRPVVEDVLSDQSLNQRGLFDPVGVKHLIEQDRTGRIDAAYTIFALVCIELWCRIFLDQKGA